MEDELSRFFLSVHASIERVIRGSCSHCRCCSIALTIGLSSILNLGANWECVRLNDRLSSCRLGVLLDLLLLPLPLPSELLGLIGLISLPNDFRLVSPEE